MKKFLKIVTVIFGLLIVFCLGYLNSGHYDSVTISSEYTEHSNYIEYADPQSEVGFIFYPGAKVDPLAYSYLADLNANVYIGKFPFEIAFLNSTVASEIIAVNPQIKSWYLGGHSLGGVAASGYYQDNSSIIDGMVFLASYPTSSMDNLNYLALFGDVDQIVGDYSDKLDFFPTGVIELENANHSGFGDYGLQKGDYKLSENEMKIQRESVIEHINQFISK